MAFQSMGALDDEVEPELPPVADEPVSCEAAASAADAAAVVVAGAESRGTVHQGMARATEKDARPTRNLVRNMVTSSKRG
jgi:hypothetical protein